MPRDDRALALDDLLEAGEDVGAALLVGLGVEEEDEVVDGLLCRPCGGRMIATRGRSRPWSGASAWACRRRVRWGNVGRARRRDRGASRSSVAWPRIGRSAPARAADRTAVPVGAGAPAAGSAPPMPAEASRPPDAAGGGGPAAAGWRSGTVRGAGRAAPSAPRREPRRARATERASRPAGLAGRRAPAERRRPTSRRSRARSDPPRRPVTAPRRPAPAEVEDRPPPASRRRPRGTTRVRLRAVSSRLSRRAAHPRAARESSATGATTRRRLRGPRAFLRMSAICSSIQSPGSREVTISLSPSARRARSSGAIVSAA